MSEIYDAIFSAAQAEHIEGVAQPIAARADGAWD